MSQHLRQFPSGSSVRNYNCGAGNFKKEIGIKRSEIVDCRIRPYSVECTRSRSISEVKQPQAGLVLGWVTAWESPVQYPFFQFLTNYCQIICDFLLTFWSHFQYGIITFQSNCRNLREIEGERQREDLAYLFVSCSRSESHVTWSRGMLS